MAGNSKKGKRYIDWPTIEKWFVTNPKATQATVAERFDVSERTVAEHASPLHGNWIKKRSEVFHRITELTEQRMIEILAQDRADDVTAFRQLEFRLQKVVLRSLELLFPPVDAPVEAHVEAEARLKALTGRELSAIINEGLRTLTETGRHRRLLAGKATAIFARANSPDVWIPEEIEQAEEIERRARRAQKALVAAAEGSPIIDIEGTVSPDSADSADPVRVSPDPPTPKKAKDPGGLFGGVAL